MITKQFNILANLIEGSGGVEELILFGTEYRYRDLSVVEARKALKEIEANTDKERFAISLTVKGGFEYFANKEGVYNLKEFNFKEAEEGLTEDSHGIITATIQEDGEPINHYYDFDGKDQALEIIEDVFDTYNWKDILDIDIEDQNEE